MKKIIRLTEDDLVKIVKKVMIEEGVGDTWKQTMNYMFGNTKNKNVKSSKSTSGDSYNKIMNFITDPLNFKKDTDFTKKINQPSSTGKQKLDGSTLSVSGNIWPFLREWEGDPKNRVGGVKEPKYQAYKDSVGVVTIGYGHTQNVKPTDVLKSKKEADDLLVKDVRENANYIRKILKSWKDKKLPGYMVTQGQFDALVSLSFNSGIGNVRKSAFIQELKNGNDKKAAELIKTYNTIGTQGVSNRRKAEIDLFNS
jgi:lysozyme